MTRQSEIVTVVVGDDHPMYREGVVRAMKESGRISVLAEAGDGRAALTAIQEHKPAVAVLDYRMPELHSGDAASVSSRPVPYPAACRPQAWSAAAAVSVLASALGLSADAQSDGLAATNVGSGIAVRGLRFNSREVSVDQLR